MGGGVALEYTLSVANRALGSALSTASGRGPLRPLHRGLKSYVEDRYLVTHGN